MQASASFVGVSDRTLNFLTQLASPASKLFGFTNQTALRPLHLLKLAILQFGSKLDAPPKWGSELSVSITFDWVIRQRRD